MLIIASYELYGICHISGSSEVRKNLNFRIDETISNCFFFIFLASFISKNDRIESAILQKLRKNSKKSEKKSSKKVLQPRFESIPAAEIRLPMLFNGKCVILSPLGPSLELFSVWVKTWWTMTEFDSNLVLEHIGLQKKLQNVWNSQNF